MRSNTIYKFLAGSAYFFAAFGILAQEGEVSEVSFRDIVAQGGPVMPVIYVLSFIALCLTFYYFLSLRRNIIVPEDLLVQVESAIEKKDHEMLEKICVEDGSPLSEITLAALGIATKPGSNYTLVRDAIADEGSRQASFLWQRIKYLQDIAVVAPMIGLLGTVLGMIKSFVGLHEIGTPRPTIIASGVAMALVTTAAGLLLGIFAMILYAYFRGRVNRLIADLEAVSGRISRDLNPEG